MGFREHTYTYMYISAVYVNNIFVHAYILTYMYHAYSSKMLVPQIYFAAKRTKKINTRLFQCSHGHFLGLIQA